MDGARSQRNYPGYTTKELEDFVAQGRGTEAMIKEIAGRKSGLSKVVSTPQVPWDSKPIIKPGRK
jgi:hypothetical protein